MQTFTKSILRDGRDVSIDIEGTYSPGSPGWRTLGNPGDPPTDSEFAISRATDDCGDEIELTDEETRQIESEIIEEIEAGE